MKLMQQLTLKMGSRMSWQNVRGSFLPSGLVADLLNLPLAGSKYLVKAQTTRLGSSGGTQVGLKNRLGRTPQAFGGPKPHHCHH